MAENGTGSLNLGGLSFGAQTALITGASRGIGAATAVALAQSGITRFFLHYNSFGEGIDTLASELRNEGCDVSLAQADLTLQSGIDNLIASYRAWHAEKGLAVDILVNNAGHLLGRFKLSESTSEQWDAVMNLNAKAVWFLSQAVAPAMVERGNGVIVNLSSIAARNGGGAGAAVYAASKAAVASLTKSMAKELAPKGIRVNAVSPGTVDNFFHEKYSNQQILDAVVAMTPAGRLGDNEEVAETIVYLCSNAARYIHGQTIEINGGMYMG